MKVIQIKTIAITLVATGSRQIRKDREVISGYLPVSSEKARERETRERKMICRFPVPFRRPEGSLVNAVI